MATMNGKIEFDQVIEKGCGIDVHKSVLVSTVQGKGIKTETDMERFPNEQHLASWAGLSAGKKKALRPRMAISG